MATNSGCRAQVVTVLACAGARGAPAPRPSQRGQPHARPRPSRGSGTSLRARAPVAAPSARSGPASRRTHSRSAGQAGPPGRNAWYCASVSGPSVQAEAVLPIPDLAAGVGRSGRAACRAAAALGAAAREAQARAVVGVDLHPVRHIRLARDAGTPKYWRSTFSNRLGVTAAAGEQAGLDTLGASGGTHRRWLRWAARPTAAPQPRGVAIVMRAGRAAPPAAPAPRRGRTATAGGGGTGRESAPARDRRGAAAGRARTR